MVCKEDVLSWFKDLESYKRIDIMYELLNMCLPFELRFLGTCIEEIGRHTYEELRGPTINANDMDKLSKDITLLNQGLLEESVRHRVLIYLSLLESRNYSVANWLYKNLLRTDWIEDYIVKGNLVKDENLQSEFLLLFVMALHHPAFTFEQKSFFGKILAHLLEFKDNRNTTSPKLNVYGYPPGFGYPTIKSMNVPEVPPIPVKTSITIPCVNETLHQQPPGLPHVPPPPPPPSTQEFIQWNRSGFACGAPEVPPPFPPPTAANVSPLVSQSTSPIHSRSNSPHRNMMAPPPPMRPPPATMPPPATPVLETLPIAATIPVDPLANTNHFAFIFPTENMKLPEDEMGAIPEERLILENAWPSMAVAPKEVKQLNGIRFGSISNSNSGVPLSKVPPRPFSIEQQLQTLNLNENCVSNSDNCSLHRSNSSSSSSLNRTPPDTPAPTALTTGTGVSTQHPQCRVGGAPDNNKTRVNGLPPNFGGGGGGNGAPPPGIPLGDTTSSPPLPPNFNSSVPYTTYPTPFTAIPSRSMFPYTNQNYRPPFTTHFPTYQTNENSFPTYTIQPYMSIIYSSPQYPARNPNCYNCGALGHFGQDCTGQNIQDITQKKYMLEYSSPPLPDTDK